MKIKLKRVHFNMRLKMDKLLHYTKLSYQKKSVTNNDQKLCCQNSDCLFFFFFYFLKLVKSLYFNRQILTWTNDQILVQQLWIYLVIEIRIWPQESNKIKYSNEIDTSKKWKKMLSTIIPITGQYLAVLLLIMLLVEDSIFSWLCC